MNCLDGEKEFRRWCETLQGRSVILVTAGQSGAGKSALVQNLLHLADNDADTPLTEQSPDPVTKVVKKFLSCINGVKIMIVDMPDLAAASDDEEKETIADLIKMTEGCADVLLYCANMGPSGKINELDHKIVKLLTLVFTSEIWERAILVLTCGNLVKERNLKHGTTAGTPTVEAAMNSYAKAFEKILVDQTAQIKVIPVLKGEGAEPRPAKEVAAVVSSETPGEEVLPGMKWDMCLYTAVLKKCGKRDAVTSTLKIIIDPIPDYVQKEAEEGAERGTAGGIICGAVAGAGIGFLAGGMSVIPGVIGGAIGAALGGVGGRKGVRAICYKIAFSRYLKTDEGKRAQFLKEIESRNCR